MSLTIAGVGLLAAWAAGLHAWYFAPFHNHALISMCLNFACCAVLCWLAWNMDRRNESQEKLVHDLKSKSTVTPERYLESSIVELSRSLSDTLESLRVQAIDERNKANKLQLSLKLMEQQKENIIAIIESIRDAVLVVDESDRLQVCNAATRELFGFEDTSWQLAPINDLIGSEDFEFFHLITKSRQNRNSHMRQEVECMRDGKFRIYECITSCVCDAHQKVNSVVLVIRDITREKEIAQMKNDFVSHVSHELKTPLASIAAYIEMLADGEVEDEQSRQEFYGIIQSQTNRLTRLIEDILNISRIESGLVKIDKENFSVGMLIQEQLQGIRSYAEEKDIELIQDDAIIHDQVCADRDMVSQVIVNLLSNAIKYTPNGGSVRVHTEVDDNARVVRVSITDTGVGIAEDEVDKVFDKFYRVKANNEQAKGTGLGLNLVKQIVEKVHSGRVFVMSEVGEGSTFGFEIPLAQNPVSQVNT